MFRALFDLESEPDPILIKIYRGRVFASETWNDNQFSNKSYPVTYKRTEWSTVLSKKMSGKTWRILEISDVIWLRILMVSSTVEPRLQTNTKSSFPRVLIFFLEAKFFVCYCFLSIVCWIFTTSKVKYSLFMDTIYSF